MDYNTTKEIETAVLDYAVKNGFTKILKYLIRIGYDIRHDNDMPLLCAVENNHVDIVKLLISSGSDIHAMNDAILEYASWHNHKIYELMMQFAEDKTSTKNNLQY